MSYALFAGINVKHEKEAEPLSKGRSKEINLTEYFLIFEKSMAKALFPGEL